MQQNFEQQPNQEAPLFSLPPQRGDDMFCRHACLHYEQFTATHTHSQAALSLQGPSLTPPPDASSRKASSTQQLENLQWHVGLSVQLGLKFTNGSFGNATASWTVFVSAQGD